MHTASSLVPVTTPYYGEIPIDTTLHSPKFSARAADFSESAPGFTETTVLLEPAPAVPPTEVPAAHLPRDHATNRRNSVRTGVSFTACIRHAGSGDEIVECDNISRGGLSFRSRKTYAVDSPIEVAAPYAPGWHAIFLPASIKHVEQLPSGTLYRYGVAYTEPLKRARQS